MPEQADPTEARLVAFFLPALPSDKRKAPSIFSGAAYVPTELDNDRLGLEWERYMVACRQVEKTDRCPPNPGETYKGNFDMWLGHLGVRSANKAERTIRKWPKRALKRLGAERFELKRTFD